MTSDDEHFVKCWDKGGSVIGSGSWRAYLRLCVLWLFLSQLLIRRLAPSVLLGVKDTFKDVDIVKALCGRVEPAEDEHQGVADFAGGVIRSGERLLHALTGDFLPMGFSVVRDL